MRQGQQPTLQLVCCVVLSVLLRTAEIVVTAPVNLIYAFHTSLTQITRSQISVDDRIRLHHEASHKIKTAATNLGLKQVATDPAFAANGMTAVSCFCSSKDMVNVFPLQLYFPEGVIAAQVLPRLLNEGLVVAGGLHKDIRGRFKSI